MLSMKPRELENKKRLSFEKGQSRGAASCWIPCCFKSTASSDDHLVLHRQYAAEPNEEAWLEVKLGMSMSLYWNAPNIYASYFERSLVAALRFQIRGSSDLMLLPLPALKLAGESCDWTEDAAFDSVRAWDVSKLQEVCSQSPIYQLQLSRGEMLFVPPACMVLEKAVSGGVAYGLKATPMQQK